MHVGLVTGLGRTRAPTMTREMVSEAARQPWHNSPVLDERVGIRAHQLRTWVTSADPVIREVLRYRELVLLAIALACLTGLIMIRVRRRRAAARGSARGPLAADAARGRHAVAGPAGVGELRTARPDFTRLAVARRGVPDPAMGRPGPSTRRTGDRAMDDPGQSRSSWDGHTASYAPGEGDGAASSPSAGGMPPGTLPARGFELGDNGIRANSADPPWEPAEKPPGEPPRAPTGPSWAADRNRPRPRPGRATDIPTPRSSDDNGR
jgi:hypothetical protein